MPLNLSPLPTNLADGGAGHTAGHNATNTAVNAIAASADTIEGRVDTLDSVSNIGNVGATLTVSAGPGNGAVKIITLTANCTITFSTPVADGKVKILEFLIFQDGTGSRLITWPAAVRWVAGTAPTLSTAAFAIDRVRFVSYNGGTSWYGDLLGKGYANPGGGTGGVAVGSTSIFSDNFSTGNFSKWTTAQWSTSGVVRNGAASAYSGTGEYSAQVVAIDGRSDVARFELRDGDSPFSGTERTEISEPIASDPTATEGDIRWIEWDMKFHSSWPVPNGSSGWTILQQWHPGSGSPTVCLDIDTNDVIYWANNATGQRTAVQAVQRDVWQHWVMKVLFSTTAGTGYGQIWVDGVQKMPQTFRATMNSASNYFKLGIYRDPVNTTTAIYYVDNLSITAP